MADTVMGRVDDLLRQAFAGAGLPAEGVRSVPATKPEFGDFQCNAAMALGKAASFKNSKYPKAQTDITDKFKLMPIPQRAIDLNPQLAGHQNPGW